MQSLPKICSISESPAKGEKGGCVLWNGRLVREMPRLDKWLEPEPVAFKISFLPNKVDNYKPRTREAEAGRSEFKAVPNYIASSEPAGAT